MANLHLLGAPLAEGGGDDEQVMRIMMLVARTGRRVNEICMLDPEPLLAIDRPSPADPQDDGGFVAKLRYQQTKIAQAPDTILVDAEIVAIIAEQQRWAAGAGWSGSSDTSCSPTSPVPTPCRTRSRTPDLRAPGARGAAAASTGSGNGPGSAVLAAVEAREHPAARNRRSGAGALRRRRADEPGGVVVAGRVARAVTFEVVQRHAARHRLHEPCRPRARRRGPGYRRPWPRP